MKKLVIFILLAICFQAFPCGNEYGHRMDGNRVYYEYFYLSPREKHFNVDRLFHNLTELNEELKGDPDNYKTWSDIALNLMKTGQADSAVKILAPLVKKYPGEYNLMANLGTAYELTGANDSAYKYISKGYTLNNLSHRGSEWIHVKILEAKIKRQKQKDWIQENAILSEEDIKTHQELEYHLRYQLRTRAPFSKKPNEVMSNLFETMADWSIKHSTYENAILAYAHALEYANGYSVSSRIERKIKTLNKRKESEGNITELPEEFVYMAKIGRLDPSLLLMGLDELTFQLAKEDNEKTVKEDSLTLLKAQLDSLQDRPLEKDKSMLTTNNRTQHSWLLAFGGIALGMSITWFVPRVIGKRRKS